MKKIWGSLPFRLLVAVAVGILAGQIANEGFMNIVVTIKYVLGQVITFCVPLIVIGFIAPSITRLGSVQDSGRGCHYSLHLFCAGCFDVNGSRIRPDTTFINCIGGGWFKGAAWNCV